MSQSPYGTHHALLNQSMYDKKMSIFTATHIECKQRMHSIAHQFQIIEHSVQKNCIWR